ncbi:UMP kinase [Patescibacteria group bacterium]|nr:UMP kinase [Patescibacteria group bacterium]MBU0963764.1 UMP kinase [Patescibacteria group bacterium]
MNYKTIILSLGGSIIIPDKINVVYLKKFKSLILGLVKEGYRFIIVTGGGDICRHYQKSSRLVNSKVSIDDLDWIGISATKYNAELIRAIFGMQAHNTVLNNPTKKIKTDKKILIGAGWKPGCSSDKDAVLLAKAYGAGLLINLSNIKYVYTADPKKIKSAKIIKQIKWDELLDLTGRKWKPGAHVPFDPEASKLAKRINLKVVICLGTDLANLENIIKDNKFSGTIIS